VIIKLYILIINNFNIFKSLLIYHNISFPTSSISFFILNNIFLCKCSNVLIVVKFCTASSNNSTSSFSTDSTKLFKNLISLLPAKLTSLYVYSSNAFLAPTISSLARCNNPALNNICLAPYFSRLLFNFSYAIFSNIFILSFSGLVSSTHDKSATFSKHSFAFVS